MDTNPSPEARKMAHGALAAQRDLDWLTLMWGDLVESRLKGTARTWLASMRDRPWQQHDPTADEALLTVNGKPAPLHLDVLDAIVDAVAWADETAEAVSQVLGLDRLPHAMSAYANPTRHLGHIRAHLHAVLRDEPDLGLSIVEEVRHRADRAAKLMGLVTDGQVLTCDCPYCGGWKMLTVVTPYDCDPIIVCMSKACRLEDDDKTGHMAWRHRRAWFYPEGWTMLARLLEDAA